ncbi:hypothetical protein Golomagni_06213, partial [Golovinomyces magnicellulatus]
MNPLLPRAANCWRQSLAIRTPAARQQLVPCRFYSQHQTPRTPKVPRQFNSPLTEPPTKTEQELLALGYIVRRTPSVELPIYKKRMSGGTKQVITIKKIHGDKRKLLSELSEALSLDSGSIRINPTTQHIELK